MDLQNTLSNSSQVNPTNPTPNSTNESNSNPEDLKNTSHKYEVFDDNNPGPSFEEVFPEFANTGEPQDYYDDEEDDEEEDMQAGDFNEYFHRDSENCTCCKGFIYSCDGNDCNKKEICVCAEGKEIEPVFFQVQDN